MYVLLADDASTDLLSLEKCLLVAAGRLDIPIQIIGKARTRETLVELYRTVSDEAEPIVVFCDRKLAGDDLHELKPGHKLVVFNKADPKEGESRYGSKPFDVGTLTELLRTLG